MQEFSRFTEYSRMYNVRTRTRAQREDIRAKNVATEGLLPAVSRKKIRTPQDAMRIEEYNESLTKPPEREEWPLANVSWSIVAVDGVDHAKDKID